MLHAHKYTEAQAHSMRSLEIDSEALWNIEYANLHKYRTDEHGNYLEFDWTFAELTRVTNITNWTTFAFRGEV
jgi:hypothetical protein